MSPPASVTGSTTSIEDYALLGDRRTAALVSGAGSIDWWCAPRFDAGACFAALLGDAGHGRFLLAPTGAASSTRRYRPATMVLETEHRVGSGRVRVTDCLALDQSAPTLVRVVEGLEGRVEMHAELVIRFDYGSIVPWVRQVEGDLRAVAGPDGLVLRGPVRLRGRGLTSVASFEVRAGERVPFVLAWHPSAEAPPAPVDGVEQVEATACAWRAWAGRCAYDGPASRDPVLRSLLTLEALTYAPTGGIVAAPTTSLPEWPGGSRNWDYRYCWVRDATLALEALLIGGYREEASRWQGWLLRAAAGDPAQLQTLYGVAGERRLSELTLGWLPGYAGSSPVRIGNAAHDQLQLDVYGELVDMLCQSLRAGLPVADDSWALVRVLLDSLEQRWREPDDGIWEVRGPRRHFTHSKVLCWVAFDGAVEIAERENLGGPVERWRAARDEIHAEVCARSVDPARGCFVQSYDSTLLDAATLMIPLVGFLPARDERVVATIEAIRRELVVDGLVQRYLPTAGSVDGIGEPEGVFLPCSFWLVEAMALAGMRPEAQELFDRLLGLANDVGLLAEEYDPRGRRLLGNFPQAFTHLALVAAAHTLEPASPHRARRRDRRRG